MHELSIIHSILDAVDSELEKQEPDVTVEAITLEIGKLAGIEISTLEFLWPAAVEQTALDSAELVIEQVPAVATCTECSAQFEVQEYFDPCPMCTSHMLNILEGERLTIKSLVLVPSTDKGMLPPINWN